MKRSNELYSDVSKVKGAYQAILEYTKELISDTKSLQDSLSIRIENLEYDSRLMKEQIQQLQDERKEQEFNSRLMKEQIQQLRDERKEQLHSSLRRQIAINIEYEIKAELLSALGKRCRRNIILKSDIYELRDQVLEKGIDVPRLLYWLNWKDDEEWDKLMDAMHYLKAFSYTAHPTTLDDGTDVTRESAQDLINEPFDAKFIKSTDWEWDDNLRTLVEHCIDVLYREYRADGEPLLYN